MTHDILLAFWFMLPAAVANGTPIIAARVPGLSNWDTRLDFGKRFNGKPLFGSHKTCRGIISGMIIATAILWIEQVLASRVGWAKSVTGGVDYPHLPTLLLGPLFGLGALGGDAIESFFKRQHGTRAGGSWMPFDQLDYIVGAIIVSLPFVILSARQYAVIVVMWFVLHIASTFVGYKLGFKEQPI